jgi:hypothetical protein
MKIIYCSLENGGEIIYRESLLSSISFGPAIALISGGGFIYDYPSTSGQNYTSDIVIIATNISKTPFEAVGVLAIDGFASPSQVSSATLAGVELTAEKTGEQNIKEVSVVYPNPFNNYATLNFTLTKPAKYSVTLFNSHGVQLMLSQGYGEAGVNFIRIDGVGLSKGLYLLKIQTRESSKTIKLIKK